MTVIKLLKDRKIILIRLPDLCRSSAPFDESTFIGLYNSVR